MKTPLVFIVFNRPSCTRRVFAEIRRARPEVLYLLADAPRAHKPGEDVLCRETRRIVEEGVDWPCRLEVDVASVNMGCGRRIAAGLTRVFGREEQAIILEDDILPDPSFFPFCEAMLDRYRGHGRVMQIGGYNRFNYHPGSSYFFSRYCDIWGWATWRESWQAFTALDASAWAEIRASGALSRLCRSPREAEMRTFVLDQIYAGRLNAWGMRWELAKLLHQAWGVLPARNLVRNIGFGPSASHTVNPFNRNQLARRHRLDPPYLAPAREEADECFEARYHSSILPNPRLEKLRSALLRRLFGKEV